MDEHIPVYARLLHTGPAAHKAALSCERSASMVSRSSAAAPAVLIDDAATRSKRFKQARNAHRCRACCASKSAWGGFQRCSTLPATLPVFAAWPAAGLLPGAEGPGPSGCETSAGVSADSGLLLDGAEPGLAGGWPRAARQGGCCTGSRVRLHSMASPSTATAPCTCTHASASFIERCKTEAAGCASALRR